MTACSLPTEAVEGFSFHHSHLWLRLLCLRPPAKKGSKHVHSKFENLGQHRCAKSKLLFGREFDSRAGVLKFRWKLWQRICICQRFLTQHMIETRRNSIGSSIIMYYTVPEATFAQISERINSSDCRGVVASKNVSGVLPCMRRICFKILRNKN